MDKTTEQTTQPAQEVAAAPAPSATPAAPAKKDQPKKSEKKEKEPKKDGAPAEKKEKPAPKKAAPVEKPVFVNTTPKGDKKDMNTAMASVYNPRAVEASWYDWWEGQGYFKGNNESDKEKFVIVIPPPNVTGSLHLGHALTCSIQDSLIRWHRMLGHNTLYLPGVDHAGIATQVVVEKKLQAEKGITRHDLGREAFISEVWKWKDTYGDRICEQLKRTGASVDWTRFAFTMDETRSKAVQEAFIRMYESGLIYRAARLVNWCCKLKTAISDIEVDYIDIDKRTMMRVPGHSKTYEFGALTSFAYKVVDSDEEIVVATTRPETMLGDTAVAVHPEDPRYKHLHGRFVKHPFVDRQIPIICDPVLVDMSFGTGAVKITPAHDPNDFECAKRNSIPMITVFNEEGKINENGGKFAGMMRFDAREAVTEELEKLGLLRGKKDNAMRLGVCSRTGDVIEPMIKPQWYCDCKGMAAAAVSAVREGRLKIMPAFHEDTWYRWLENIRDWCISRQLWWGHRIPAYFVRINGSTAAVDRNDMKYWVVGRTQEEALNVALKRFELTDPSQVTLEQDEDVLDTWFSSGLFPFSVFGWPEDGSQDLKAFFPTTLLETGLDILFFWVARMVMMSLQLTGELPFKEVYLHAIVRDKFGRKMSKSLGNVIDPIDVIEGITLEGLYARLGAGNLDAREVEKAKAGQKEQFPDGIEECGADALRFSLLSYCSQGRDINLDILRVVGYRNFCNKLWNANKFALMNLDGFMPPEGLPKPSECELADQWILSRLNNAVARTNAALKAYDFGEATSACYNFWLYELCDVYLEALKPVMFADRTVPENARKRFNAQHVLYTCVETGLRLLHPMMPFLTEELWQRLPGCERIAPEKRSIMVQDYPLANADFESAAVEAQMAFLQDVMRRIRSIKAQYGLTTAQRPAAFVRSKVEQQVQWVNQQADLIRTLAFTGSVTGIPAGEQPPAGCAVEVLSENCEVFVLLKGLIDIDAEIGKLEKKVAKTREARDALFKKTQAPGYTDKVPAAVQEQTTAKIASYEAEAESIVTAIEGLKKIKE